MSTYEFGEIQHSVQNINQVLGKEWSEEVSMGQFLPCIASNPYNDPQDGVSPILDNKTEEPSYTNSKKLN